MTENGTARETQTYWQLVWRDFRRNRMALLGAAIVFLVITVAVFCPLLANQRPLYLSAVLHGDFDNSLAIAIEQMRKLAEAPGEEERALVLGHLAELEEHLAADDVRSVRALRERFRAAAPADSAPDGGELRALAGELETFYSAALQPVIRYPAIRSLRTAEVYVMAAYLLIILVWLAGRRIRGILLKGAIVLVGAALVTLAWKAAYPTVKDTRPYRQLIHASDFAESGGVVVQPPVPFGENENIIRNARQRPSWLLPKAERPPLREWHWLGTDTNGRDVLSRMVYGARVSMLVGILSVSIYTIIGIVMGALAGFYRRWVDIGLSRIIETVICFPPLMVILAVQAFLLPSLFNMILALAALWWTGVARLQRAEFLRLVNQDFVQGVRAIGGSNLRIIFLHILPNGLGPILVLVSFGIAGSIVIESALSFLGFGVPQPMASWGDLLNNGRNDIQGTWWLTVFPGLAIFITVTCFNLMGEGVRDALDPRKAR